MEVEGRGNTTRLTHGTDGHCTLSAFIVRHVTVAAEVLGKKAYQLLDTASGCCHKLFHRTCKSLVHVCENIGDHFGIQHLHPSIR